MLHNEDCVVDDMFVLNRVIHSLSLCMYVCMYIYVCLYVCVCVCVWLIILSYEISINEIVE